MNVLGRIFLNSRKDRRKDVRTQRRFSFVRCRITYVLNKFIEKNQIETITPLTLCLFLSFFLYFFKQKQRFFKTLSHLVLQNLYKNIFKRIFLCSPEFFPLRIRERFNYLFHLKYSSSMIFFYKMSKTRNSDALLFPISTTWIFFFQHGTQSLNLQFGY